MDWCQPALPSAVDYFERHYYDAARNRLDMDGALVIVPGSRAGRRLAKMLAERAQHLDAVLFPPQIQTVGTLPEKLYEPKRPFADELTQQLAWVESIKSQKARARKFFPHLPHRQETVDWLELAAMLARIHRELAAEGLDFLDVVECGRNVRGFTESRRWRFLRALQEGYLDILDGLDLWDLQTARLFAIKQRECRTDLDLFLLGTVDLNKATRQMLGQVASQVVALIHAPESEALGFDDYGCLDTFYWKDKQIPVQSEQVTVTDQPADQADAVCHWLGSIASSRSNASGSKTIASDQLAIGVPDNEVARFVERKLSELGVNTHWSVGRQLSESGPGRLLEAICAALEMDRYPEFAVLLRHPDVEMWLDQLAAETQHVSADNVISESDVYFNEHLVPGFGKWLGNAKHQTSLRWAIGEVSRILKPLQMKKLSLSQWAEPILVLLSEVYQHVELDFDNEDDSTAINSLTKIREILESFTEIPESLDVRTDAVNVLRLVLQQLGQINSSGAPASDSVEMLGWLELPLDIADNVVVTGFNEGIIPESLNADMFLPNSMRKELAVTDNQRRFARDAYAVTSMVHSKKELRFIVGKRNLEGDPLMPSRIFFATDRETIAKRVLQFSDPIGFVDAEHSSGSIGELPARSQFMVPYPELDGVSVDAISVTAFRTFLKCPYRFYLQHVLRLRQIHDSDRELNALAFGNLLHELFRRFGESRLRFSENENEIAEFLEHELDEQIRLKLGRRHLPAVEIQLQQIRHRLNGFATWQAARTTNGWEIKFVEKRPMDSGGVPFEFEPGRQVRLRGTIDRIDFNERFNTWQILDYKTGEKGDDPNRTHMENGQWVDLQLPLYRHIAKSFEVDGNVQLGYILIPKAAKDIKESIARWTDAQLEEAMSVAKECSRRIVDLEFWEPTHPAPPFVGQEFASICQDNVFEPQLAPPPDGQLVTSTGGAK